MANFYITILDTTKARTDEKQMQFFIVGALTDIGGLLTGAAEENKTPLNKMRLFINPNRKTWDNSRQEYLKRVYFRGESERRIFE